MEGIGSGGGGSTVVVDAVIDMTLSFAENWNYVRLKFGNLVAPSTLSSSSPGYTFDASTGLRINKHPETNRWSTFSDGVLIKLKSTDNYRVQWKGVEQPVGTPGFWGVNESNVPYAITDYPNDFLHNSDPEAPSTNPGYVHMPDANQTNNAAEQFANAHMVLLVRGMADPSLNGVYTLADSFSQSYIELAGQTTPSNVTVTYGRQYSGSTFIYDDVNQDYVQN